VKPHHTVVVGCHAGSDHFLVQCRPEGAAYAGLWEFPGGKMEPGETMHETLHREWLEELGVTIRIGEYMSDCSLDFPGYTALLVLFAVSKLSDWPEPRINQTIRWVTLGELAELPLVPSFERFLPHLLDRSCECAVPVGCADGRCLYCSFKLRAA